jgi:SsrA-binding protein
VKIELGVAKGKEAADKRQDLKARAEKREVDREVARFNKKHA